MKHHKIISNLFVVLACLNYCKSEDCTTTQGLQLQCQFPFEYNFKIYKSCTKVENNGTDWCATDYYNTTLEARNWGNCSKSCPTEDSIGIPSEEITIVVAVSVSFLLIISSIFFTVCCYMKQKMKNMRLKSTTDSHEKKCESHLNIYSPQIENQVNIIQNENFVMINPNLSLNEQASNIPYSGKHEIDRGKFEIGQLLGTGSFGSVFEGSAEDLIQPRHKMKVAIKTVNNSLDFSQLYALLCEIKVLDMLDLHLNLVNMFGACTSQIKNGQLWLVLEYCPYGDMKSFLLKNKNILKENLKCQGLINDLNERLLIKWAYDIAKGMEYLSFKKIMHGDLAARNILIDTQNGTVNTHVAKISDFGLSRAFYDKTSYKKQERSYTIQMDGY